MGLLNEIYENLTEEIKKVLTYEDAIYYIFNGPSEPACLSSYYQETVFGSGQGSGKVIIAISKIKLSRKFVLEKGVNTEQELEQSFENLFGSVFALIKKPEKDIFVKIGKGVDEMHSKSN